MSILIRNMEMPNTCKECIIGNPKNKTCYILGSPKRNLERREDCPLIEVPPHGRLIDADALNTYDVSPIYEFCVMGVTEEDIGLAPTIIEAEGSDT